MIELLSNFYQTTDLNDVFLTKPLKFYHSFFAKKIEENSGLAKVALRIVNLVTGFFAYPLFGFLAGFGLLVKLTGLCSLRKLNAFEKDSIEKIRNGISRPGLFSYSKTYQSVPQGWTLRVIQEFQITKTNFHNCCREINAKIDSISNQFKKIYIYTEGTINADGSGAINVQLKLRERV